MEMEKKLEQPSHYVFGVIWKILSLVLVGAVTYFLIRYFILTFSCPRDQRRDIANAADIVLACIYILLLLVIAVCLTYCAFLDCRNAYESVKTRRPENSSSFSDVVVVVQDEQFCQITAVDVDDHHQV